MQELIPVLGGVVGLLCLYVVYGLESALNGAQIGRHPIWFPVQAYAEHFMWSIPGGFRRKTDYVREMVSVGNGAICGRTKNWDYETVRTKSLYRECARDVLPGPLYLWIFTAVVGGLPALLTMFALNQIF